MSCGSSFQSRVFQENKQTTTVVTLCEQLTRVESFPLFSSSIDQVKDPIII